MRPVPIVLIVGACVTEQELARALDRDQDGYRTAEAGGLDCDDQDPLVNPNEPEVCDDDLDNDCDGVIDDSGAREVPWYLDEDGDGYGIVDVIQRACAGRTDLIGWSLEPGDCDDTDAAARPDAAEACDGLDNDCDGAIDEGC